MTFRLRFSRPVWVGLFAITILAAARIWPVTAAEAIAPSQTRMARDLQYLSADELEGRGVGTQGINQAADYIRNQFSLAGLNVQSVNGGAFQKFSATMGAQLGQPNTFYYRDANGNNFQWNFDTDFRPMSFGGSGNFSGPLVFCGYGIDAPDKKYNDFAGIDVKGKVVIILRRTPRQDQANSPFSGPHGSLTTHSELRTKVSNAFGKGAAAILFVNDPHTGRSDLSNLRARLEKAQKDLPATRAAREALAPNDTKKAAELDRQIDALQTQVQNLTEEVNRGIADPLMKFGYAGEESLRSIPILHITRAACNYALKGALGTDLDQLEKQIDSDLKPRSADLNGWSAEGTVTIHREQVEVKNVIGVLPGQGPLADESVIIGAHYDHIGRGAFGSLAPTAVNEIHNGADDNASGTTALLEIARRLTARKEKLSRRVIFIAFTAEESGLIGSARYCREPVFPLDKTIAMLNMDMVGRQVDDRLIVFGTGTSPVWEPMMKRLGEAGKFKLSFKPEGFGPSDHSSFYAKQIPVLHFFTGTHPDYHRPGDDFEKINLRGMNRIVDLVEQAVIDVANAPKRPAYVQVAGMASLFRDKSRPYFGSIPDYSREEPGSLRLSGVAPQSPAAKAGLQAGDRIVQFGANKVENIDDYDLALRKCEPGEVVDVIIIRGTQRMTLKVILGKPRGT